MKMNNIAWQKVVPVMYNNKYIIIIENKISNHNFMLLLSVNKSSLTVLKKK